MRNEERTEIKDMTDGPLTNNSAMTANTQPNKDRNSTHTSNAAIATSAPSTLAKRPPEQKTGEVYV